MSENTKETSIQARLLKEFDNVPDYISQLSSPEKKLNILIKLAPYLLTKAKEKEDGFYWEPIHGMTIK